jgi:hypothetical protein
MGRPLFLLLRLLALPSVLALPRAGIAAEPAPIVSDDALREALAHYDRGKAAFESGDFVAAAVEFSQAHEHFSALATSTDAASAGRARDWDRTSLSAEATSYSRADMPVEAHDAFLQLRAGYETVMTPEQRSEIDAALQRIASRIGQLEIRGAPGQAEVRIDGILIPVPSLARPVRLAAGEHHVEVRAERYRVFAAAITVAPRQTATLHVLLTPAETHGRLRFESAVTPALLELDGRAAGRLPFEAVLRPGKHKYKLRAEGHTEESGDIDIAAGERTVMRVRPVPSRRPLGLRIEPAFFGVLNLRNDTPLANNVEPGESYSEGTNFYQGAALRLFFTSDYMRSLHLGVAFEYYNRPLNMGEFGLVVDWCPSATTFAGGQSAWCPVTVGALLPAVGGQTGKFTGGESALRLGTKLERHFGLYYFHFATGLGAESYKRSAINNLTVGTWYFGVGMGVDL